MRRDKITEAVIDDLKSRSERGIKKYNTTLDQNNKDDYMNHLYEELLDAAQYAKKEMSIIPTIQKMIEENPNDQKLGMLIRDTFRKF
jgi:lipopolysaccharide biosynthesis regulator YciM